MAIELSIVPGVPYAVDARYKLIRRYSRVFI